MDYYEILQVHPKADADAIQAAYERLCGRYDPARLAGAADELISIAQQRRAEIEQAYAALSDPARRSAYDNERQHANEANAPSSEKSNIATPAADERPKAVDSSIDYRILSPARRQERAKGFDVQPVLSSTSGSRAPGRATKRAADQQPWATPVVVVSGLVALIAAVTFFAAGLSIPSSDTRTSAGPAAAATAQAALSPTQPASTDDIVNQFETLIPAAQQQAESASQNPDAWVNLGNLLYDSVQVVRENMPQSPLYEQRLSRWLQASEAYDKALALQPNNVAVRSDRGVSLCYYGADRKDQRYVAEGLKEAQQAAQQAENDPRVLFNLGVCQVSTDPPQTDQALASWRQVTTMSSTAPSLASQAQRLIEQHSQ